MAGADGDGDEGGTKPAARPVSFYDAATAATPTGVASMVAQGTQGSQDTHDGEVASGAGGPPPPRTFSPGDRIGEGDRFEIVSKLGAGGMGHVFRATDWHLDRTVAVKFILQNDGLPLEQLVVLLKREAKATAKLSHENIVAIFDMDTFDGVPFLVMELLDGQSLDLMMERSRLGPLRATQIMIQVARGLAHAHANGIVHRDLKPSNVFILRDGRAKILDFGISRFERPLVAPASRRDGGDGGGEVGPTITGVGTPAFMAPEQWRGDPQDARTDIWAAGVMFYQLLTGRLPYTVPELLMRFSTRVRSRGLAPSVRLHAPGLPEEAETLVATALDEEPAGRFPSARELLAALRELERVLGGAAEGESSSRTLPQVERRPLTLLACALAGVDTLELDDIVELDQRFYQVCADAVKREGGIVGTPIGSKFFCCFGYPFIKETDAQGAVRAALQIAATMREHAARDGQKLDFQIGVHSGLVGLPNLVAAGPGLPAMQGDVPNVAARVAGRAGSNAVLLSQATLELLGGRFVTEAEEDGELRPRAHRVIAEAESESRFQHASTDELTPLVGREAELAELYRLWGEAKEGRGQIVVLSGEPGIGKSRLVQTLKDRVIEEQNTRLTCQCWPHFRNSALHPLIQLLLRSMDIEREDTPEEKLAKLERNLTGLGFTLPESLPLFASMLSIPFEARYAPLGLAPEQQKLKTLEALASMLLRTALGRPTLFIFEDMHWVDHSTIEYLNALIDLLRTSRILVVLTSRPEFHVPWSARPHLHLLALDRLSSAFTASMIERASKDRRLPPEITERLIATADGVPLFVEELTRMVVESWSLHDTTPGSRLNIPGTLHELLLARLDKLRGAGKEVAQVGSILGRDFDYALIQRVAPLDELSLQEGLDILGEAGLLHHQGRPPESKYVFKHALIQHTAYQSLVKGDRQRHHQRAAEVLTQVFKETAELEPELLAHHHAEAGNAREAIVYWEKAGQRATQRGALVEAIDHYTRAREALKTLPEGLPRDKRELAVLLALGSPLMSVHGYATPEVEKTYARARELARAAGGQADIFPAMQGLWQFYYVRGLLPTSRKLGEELLEIAREAGSSTFLLLAHRSIASSAFLQGDYQTCRHHTEEGFAIYDMYEHGSLALRTGHDPGVAHGVYTAWSLWMLGYPDQSLRRVDEMIELAERLAHPLTTAYALCFASLMHNHRGEHAAAKARAERALEITVPNKFALWTAWAKMQRGWGVAGLGDVALGIPQMKEGLEGWKNTGARVGFTFFPVTLAEICLHAGRLDETAQLLDEATPMVAANDEHFYEPEMCRLKGELALKLAKRPSEAAEEAASHFRSGLDVARRLSGRSRELRLQMSRARLLAAQGERAQALAELGPALAWFSEGHGTGDLRAARAQLDSLEAAPRPPPTAAALALGHRGVVPGGGSE